MDLFTPIVKDDRFHPNFKNIIIQANGFNCDVLNDWARNFIDRDNNFVVKFQTSFNSTFWELYIFTVLKYFDLNVDFSKVSPDFHVLNNGGFCIEATIASNDNTKLPEYESFEVEVPYDLNEFNRETIIRLSNRFSSKYSKLKSSYLNKAHVQNKPFILAVAAFDQPNFFLQSSRAIEALLYDSYVNEESFIRYGGELEGKPIGTVYKDNDAPIEIGLFNSTKYKEISAVMFNSCATWGKIRALSNDPNPNIIFEVLRYNPNSQWPYHEKVSKQEYTESLIDGLRIYHNPYSEHPLSKEIFKHKDVCQVYSYDLKNLIVDIHENHLMSRQVRTNISANKIFHRSEKAAPGEAWH